MNVIILFVGGDDIKTITLRLEDSLHQELKIHSAKTTENMQDILVRLIKKELEHSEEQKKK